MKPMREPVVVIGGGGHAKVLLSVLQICAIPVAGLYDDDPKSWGTELLGVPILGPIDALNEQNHALGIIAIGNNLIRKKFASHFNFRWATLIHPTAVIHPSVIIGAGSVVFAGAIIQPDATVGEHVIVNTGATVDHDCVIRDFVHLAPGVHLAGDVQVEEGAFVGISSAAIQGSKIGAWATVGAGGVVIKDVPPGVTAVGLPAKPLLPS